MKEVASITRFTFSAVDFHSTGHILAAVGFCCYLLKCCLNLFVSKSLTGSLGRRVKRIENKTIWDKKCSLHKIGFQNIQVNVLTASFQEFQG